MRKDPSRGSKTENACKNDDNSVPRRVLRSTTRRLAAQRIAELQETKKEESPKKKLIESCASDVIILNETCASVSQKRNVNNIYTSTPIGPNHLKRFKLDLSRVRQSEIVKEATNETESKEVIVLSDTSTTQQLIVLSDDEGTSPNDTDIQILSTVSKKDETKVTAVCPNKTKENIGKRMSMTLRKSTTSTRPRYSVPKRKPQTKKRHQKRAPKHVRRSGGKPLTDINCAPVNVGDNVFLENPVILPKIGLRPIIIDGSNVAFSHSNNLFFSCKGLEICIKYFKSRGHEVTAFVPHFRIQNNKCDNPRLLDRLVKNGDVVLTPSRMVDGRPIVSYDDRYIVQTAAIKGGIIVTRDNYRDLLHENPAWSETIKYRLLQYTWVKDLLMFPNDPLGLTGPNLEQFLKFG